MLRRKYHPGWGGVKENALLQSEVMRIIMEVVEGFVSHPHESCDTPVPCEGGSRLNGDTTAALRQLDDLLGEPHQIWLLGSGVSKESGVPIMGPLTDRVRRLLRDEGDHRLDAVMADLPDDAHIEHALTHLGDLIEIAGRVKTGKAAIGGQDYTAEQLRSLHAKSLEHIRNTIRWGYRPAGSDAQEAIGTSQSPISDVAAHVGFVNAVYSRRSGLGERPPVVFATTNYDTLLEDALTLSVVPTTDGFCGGAMAFWDPQRPTVSLAAPFDRENGWQARVIKLHGSVDWLELPGGLIVRRRDGSGYPTDSAGCLVIYPQATKYLAIRKEPFSTLFSAFRTALANPHSTLLAVCGYGFGDRHINDMIEEALKTPGNQLTVVAFVRQSPAPEADGIPSPLRDWLTGETGDWHQRVIVAGNRGLYIGSLNNCCPPAEGQQHDWWTFAGVSKLLKNGPEVLS